MYSRPGDGRQDGFPVAVELLGVPVVPVGGDVVVDGIRELEDAMFEDVPVLP